MKYAFILCGFLLLVPQSSRSKIIRVPGDVAAIQAAIDSAVSHDTVLVSEGVYYENIKFHGKAIVLTSRYFLTADWQTVFKTIIDGSPALNKDTASTIQLLWGEDSTTVIDGFTIRGGSGTKYMFPNGNGTSPWQEGAGIILHASSAIIRNNFISGNTIHPLGNTNYGGGGGIASMYGSPTVVNNIIANNTSGYAGGLVLNWSGGKIKNNIFWHNAAMTQYGGGGVMVWKVPKNAAFVENNTIVGNSSTAVGGGVVLSLLDASSVPVIRNNIVWNNTQASGGQFVLPQYGTYNDVQDYSGGTTISIDPQFADSRFTLSPASPCIDAGDTASACADREDSGNTGHPILPSQGTLRNDMGAYGGGAAKILPEFVAVGVQERKSMNQNIFPLRNYPNPFNPTTLITYEIPAGGTRHTAMLRVYDILGRVIATLVEGTVSAGPHQVRWDASGQSSGVYFCRLDTEYSTQTKKLILMK